MSRIRMKVFIDNQTEVALSSLGHELESGDLTPDWQPPARIEPGTRAGFQGEGDLAAGVPITGTEGRVRYGIGTTGGELYIHWNSPLVESQYGNTFHVWAPPGFEVAHAGGQGHDATLELRLRRTALRRVPRFNPAGRRLRFLNSWARSLPVMSMGFLANRLLEIMPGPLGDLGVRPFDESWLPLTHADAGLCGGMVFAVMDYYAHNRLPPSRGTSPDSADDPLFHYIRDRLWDSFDVTGSGFRYLAYSSPLFPNGDEGVMQNVLGLARGRAWVTYREAWPQIRADIDAGRLSPMGLIQTDSLAIGDNHQVLAHAYEQSGQEVTLFVYDPNELAEVTYRFDITRTDGEVHVRKSRGGKRIFAFFRTGGYAPKEPKDGRRFSSARDAVGAATHLTPPLSMRAAVQGSGSGGSLAAWLRSR